jgi:membrane-bound inhibitor of C-type lysozyme
MKTMTNETFMPSPAAVALAALLLSACSAGAPSNQAAVDDGTISEPTAITQDNGSEPAPSLSFEWSANGFEQLPAHYVWSGSGQRDDAFQPNVSLSVPETDDVIWSSSCETNGAVTTQLYFARPKTMIGNSASFKFETDKSAKTLAYRATYMASGQAEGFEIVQKANDPLFAEMKQGSWAYVQIGEGAEATKYRISLAGAATALKAFLPACSAKKPKAAAEPKPVAVTYACKDGRTAKATYLGNDTDTPVVRLEIDGAHYLLSQTVSGSGARYDNSGEKLAEKRRAWHNKGKGALLIESAWDDVDGINEMIVHCLEP